MYLPCLHITDITANAWVDGATVRIFCNSVWTVSFTSRLLYLIRQRLYLLGVCWAGHAVSSVSRKNYEVFLASAADLMPEERPWKGMASLWWTQMPKRVSHCANTIHRLTKALTPVKGFSVFLLRCCCIARPGRLAFHPRHVSGIFLRRVIFCRFGQDVRLEFW